MTYRVVEHRNGKRKYGPGLTEYRVCPVCREEKHYTAFYTAPRPDGTIFFHRATCKECERMEKRKRRALQKNAPIDCLNCPLVRCMEDRAAGIVCDLTPIMATK